MTWRTIFIKSKAKLSYKNDYLVVRNEEIHMIHLSEINTVIIDSTAVTITSYLISEMLSRKIKLIFCDDKILYHIMGVMIQVKKSMNS